MRWRRTWPGCDHVLYDADGLPDVVVNAVPAWHSAVTPRHPHETSNAGEGRAATGPRMDADTSRHMPQGIDKHVATNESYA
ncbi:hypothetical protein SMJ63A_140109 [Stenotrophomonas geniculata]